MPELAEIKIMAEYINSICDGLDFTTISTSPEVSNRLSLPQPTNLQVFKLTARARGKELLLIVEEGYPTERRISVSMGMSGYWTLSNTERPKHTHLSFNTHLGRKRMCLVDTRRFAKWKWVDDFSNNRGPCPVAETNLFKENVFKNIHRKHFDKPIHLLLMDQRYFNGIGNYLRAEILFRADQDPFEKSRDAFFNNPLILELCTQVPLEAYVIGGGQLKDWKNPFDIPAGGFSEWIQCYGRSDSSIIDASGRKLWYFQAQCK